MQVLELKLLILKNKNKKFKEEISNGKGKI